jgi:hypothetical protein
MEQAIPSEKCSVEQRMFTLDTSPKCEYVTGKNVAESFVKKISFQQCNVQV